MKRVLVLLIAMLLCVPAMAQSSPQEWLDRLNRSLGERYAMHIYVAVGDVESVADQYSGYFMVDGDAYYMNLGVMEVYSDGKLRYEVNNERKEVTEDRVNLDAVDLLSNPTRAFDFIDGEYVVSILSVSGDMVVLNLEPKSKDLGISYIALTMERCSEGVLPKEIVYNYDGDVITISLSVADASMAKLPRWDAKAYRAYDIVSFL